MRRDIDRLLEGPFDLLIVGGGIVGAGIAWDAAGRGLRVVLVEQEDFASGTSSKTTKLIHGGIRYLENLDFRLVREAIRERQLLLTAAPHLVSPLPFLIPVAGKFPRPWPMVRAGVSLYGFLAGRSGIPGHRFLSRQTVLREEPILSESSVEKGAVYYDAQMDDARMVWEVLFCAMEKGAVAANHLQVQRWIMEEGRIRGAELKDRVSGRLFSVSARVIVNATGPWSDRLRCLADPRSAPIVRPSKGIHLVYPDIGLRHALLLSSGKDNRIFFLIPWRGMTLIGTTDTDYQGDPGQAHADAEDVNYLLESSNRIAPRLRLLKERIISTFAGVRPLIARDQKDPWAVSRSHLIHQDSNGLLSVVGGKFTTFRRTAEEVVNRVCALLPDRKTAACVTTGSPIGYRPSTVSKKGIHASALFLVEKGILEPAAVERLIKRYGIQTPLLFDAIKQDPSLAAPLCSHHPFLAAEVRFAVEHEMAVTLADLLQRRFQVDCSPCRGFDMLPACAQLMGALLGWSAERRQEMTAQVRRQLLGMVNQ
ncbi:MAG: glycerol-3-phosphate dehydrogenase [Candidatus Omnitrophica bacterium]|nr:glycerol-3-phosphate dehydrogenase [Candidatus Omnitrophota bacterium]